MSDSNVDSWPDTIWQAISHEAVKEAGKVRVAQKVFPTRVLESNPTEVINDVVHFDDFSIREGDTKSFVELFQEFALTSAQVARESETGTGKALSRMAAKSIALAEDMVLLQGRNARLPGGVQAMRIDSAEDGLLGVARPGDADDGDPLKVTKPIRVPRAESPRPGLVFGESVFFAVADGIAKLVGKGQAPTYGLFLPTDVYADTYVPPSDASLVTTAERIKPLVEGGYVGTGTLPADRGLLVALGGEPTTVFVGREIGTEFVRKEGARHIYRVVERVQFVARDPRALVLLEFEPAPAGDGG